jgi:Peptidase family M1 domain/Peptidase M1 N-terminal domain
VIANRARVVLLGAALVALVAAGGAAAAGKKSGQIKLERVSDAPSELVPGESFEITGKVRNTGKRSVPARITATLSSEPKREPGELALGTVKVKVPKRAESGFAIDAEVPVDAEPGEYYQVVCAARHGTKPATCEVDRDEIAIEAAEFTPGARSLGDPLFPQIGNGGYDVKHYDIDLDYDPVANVFEDGTSTTISARATQNLSELSLDFQDLEVSEVLVDGEEAEFEQVEATPDLSPIPEVIQPMKLVVTPANGLPAGERFEVVVSYTGTPVHVIDPDTSSEGWIPACYTVNMVETCDGAFVVNEPIGAQGWFPGNNYPTDKASFDTAITVPDGKTALGIGELRAMRENASEGTTTWKWRSEEPAATYLTTATSGDFIYGEGELPEVRTGRTLDVYNAVDSSATATQLDAVNASIRRMRGQLNFLSERVFGPYPFSSTGVVADRAAGVGYALEVQTKAHFSGSNSGPSVGVNTLLHEIAHQWMGNSVSPATWREIYFNEGWATWATWYWAFEDNSSTTSPAEQFETLYASTPDEEWEQAPALLDDPAELFFPDFPVYIRSAMTIEAYRQIVGEDAFFDFTEELAEEFEYGNISTEEYIQFALDESGFEGAELDLLEDFFEQWLLGGAKPTILPEDF